MKKMLKILGIIILIPLLYVVGCILYAHFTYHQPDAIETLHENNGALPLQDSLFPRLYGILVTVA